MQRFRDQLHTIRDQANTASATTLLNAFDDKLAAVVGSSAGGGRRGGGGGGARRGAPAGPTFTSISGELLTLMNLLEEADVEPTSAQMAAVRRTLSAFASLEARWNTLKTTELAALNAALHKAGHKVTIAP